MPTKNDDDNTPDFTMVQSVPVTKSDEKNETKKVRLKIVGHGWEEVVGEKERMHEFEKDLKTKGEEMASSGYRKSNLPGIHNYEVILKKSGNNNTIERIICPICLEPFLADINGNRLLIDNKLGGFIVVKFMELLAVCPKCNVSCFIDLHGIYDPTKDNEYDISSQEYNDVIEDYSVRYDLVGDYNHTKREMEKNNIVDPNKRQAFLKKELIKDRRSRAA